MRPGQDRGKIEIIESPSERTFASSTRICNASPGRISGRNGNIEPMLISIHLTTFQSSIA